MTDEKNQMEIGFPIWYSIHQSWHQAFHWGNIVINNKAIIGDNFCVYRQDCY